MLQDDYCLPNKRFTHANPCPNAVKRTVSGRAAGYLVHQVLLRAANNDIKIQLQFSHKSFLSSHITHKAELT